MTNVHPETYTLPADVKQRMEAFDAMRQIINEQSIENAKLRNALRGITNAANYQSNPSASLTTAIENARQALEATE